MIWITSIIDEGDTNDRSTISGDGMDYCVARGKFGSLGIEETETETGE